MKSPGNFLIIDPETTKLLQILAKIHPYGNKVVLKIILKFYIKLAKHSRKKKLEPLTMLEGIIDKYLSEEYTGFELKKIERIDKLIEEAEGVKVPLESRGISDDILELKTLIRELRSTIGSGLKIPPETFSPKESAKLLKIQPKGPPKERGDYRQIRKKNRPRKINF